GERRHPGLRHVPGQWKRLNLWVDFERQRTIRPVQEVRMVTNTPVGVLGTVVILPSCLDFAVVHQLLRQTSTCRDRGRNELVTQDCAWITRKPEVQTGCDGRGPRRGTFGGQEKG